MTLGHIAVALYLIAFPLLTVFIAFLHKRLVVRRAEEKIARKRLAKQPPKPWGPIWWKRFKFTLQDKRQLLFAVGKKKEEKADGPGIKRNLLWWLLWTAGLGVACIAYADGSSKWIFWSLVIYFVAFTFAVQSAHKLVKHREYVIGRIYEIAQPKFGLPAGDPADAHVRILSWRDYTKPDSLEIDVPTNFSDAGEESFLKQFNQVFGRETAWVPDNKPPTKDAKGNDVPAKIGWDYEKGVVTLRAVPPLPLRAPWSAHYVLSPAIAWSFFPVAIGVENGTTLVHPETGVREHVLGFDLSGKQGKAAAAAGEVMSTRIIKSPMLLVAGGTGGGKAISLTEKTLVIRTI